MIVRLLLAAAIIIAIFSVKRHLQKLPPPQRRKKLIHLGIGALLLLIFLAAISGRLHWLGALAAAAVALLMRLLPLLQFWLQHRNSKSDERQSRVDTDRPMGDLSVEEARQILGVGENATETEIAQAHRKLIQKLHPDRGGNDYLAAKINRAKEVLIKRAA